MAKTLLPGVVDPGHPEDCTGCPSCDTVNMRALMASPEELGRILAERDKGRGAGAEGRVLRVASAGTLRTGGAACGCGGGEKKRNEKLLAEARALTGRREEDLRALTDAALIQLIADAVVERRELTHPVCPYGLTPRTAGVVDWSGKGEPGARTWLTAEERRVYTHPPDAYGLAQMDAVRELANSPPPAMRAAAGELPKNWAVNAPGDSYDLAGLDAARLAASRQEVAA